MKTNLTFKLWYLVRILIYEKHIHIYSFWITVLLSLIIYNVIGGCDRRAKRGQEEPPHIWGQGQKPGGPHAWRAAAKRSYPTSEVRGNGREYQTVRAQERLRGATLPPRSGGRAREDTQYPRLGAATRGVTPRPRSGVVAGRSYPTPLSPRPGAVGGRGYPTPPCPRPGAVAGRTNPTSKEPWLRGQRRA